MEISRKKNETLRKFNGNLGEFQLWRDRVVDHVSRDNNRWRILLDTLQSWQVPITREWLLTQTECGYNGWDLAVKLEGFLVEHMNDSLYRRRRQLSGGVMGNGFEMWRWLFNEFQGGSDAIKLGGARRLQEWPRCTKLESLPAHLDSWCDCLQRDCPDLLAAPGTLKEFEDEPV